MNHQCDSLLREWQIIRTNTYIGKNQLWTWCFVKRVCVCNRDAPTCVRIRLWLLRLDDSSRVLIGAAGMWWPDWCRWNVGFLIGQSTCRRLALAREAIDSTRAGASGSLQSAITKPLKLAHAGHRFVTLRRARIIYHFIVLLGVGPSHEPTYVSLKTVKKRSVYSECSH